MGSKKGFNKYKIDGDITILYLENRKGEIIGEALIDTEDLQKLINVDLFWTKAYHYNVKSYYVYGTKYLGIINGKPRYKSIKLHRFVMGQTNPRIIIDHIDHDGLNNRKENLRCAAKPDNEKNRKGANSNNKSGYRNVSWSTNEQVWLVQLQVNGKNTCFGKFPKDQLEQAAQLAKEKRIEIYGEFAGKD